MKTVLLAALLLLAIAVPRSVAELRENLAAVDRGPLSPAEMEEMRTFGRAAHG